MARGGKGGDFLEDQRADFFEIVFGAIRDGGGGERDLRGGFAGAAVVAVAAVFVGERFAEVAEEAAGDAAGGGGEIEDLREALGVAGFALGEKFGLVRGDGGGVALGGVGAEAEAVAQAGGLLHDGAGFLQPGERFDEAVARFAEFLGGGFEFEREVFRAAPAGGEERGEEAAAVVVEAGEDGALGFQKLHLRALVKGARGAEQTVEFEVGDDGLDDERADVRLLAEVVAAHVELLARAEHFSHERLDGRGLGRVAEGEVFQRHRVIRAGEQFAERGLAVAARAPDFLLIVLQRLRQVEMDDAADVRLIYPHAEGDGRHDDFTGAAHEGLLRRVAILGAHPRVIRPRREARPREVRGHVLGGFLESHIHHRRADLRAGEPLREHRQPLARSTRRHAQVQVFPAKGSLHMPLARDAERLANIPRHLRRRRGREREHRLQRQLLRHAREAQILGAKIVPPFRNAVRLINRQQRDFHPPQSLGKRLAREPLRRDVEQLQLPLAQVRIHPLRLLRREAGVESRRRDPARPQRIDLIFHQRDERRNDQRRPFQ